MSWRQALIGELAKKYGFGCMVPEGDGWSWEWEPDKKFIDACEELPLDAYTTREFDRAEREALLKTAQAEENILKQARAGGNAEKRYRVALQEIVDSDSSCGCTHDDENCCLKVEESCARCIADLALRPRICRDCAAGVHLLCIGDNQRNCDCKHPKAGGDAEKIALWISVKEKLPEFNHVVLAYCTNACGTPFIEAMTCEEFEGNIEWFEQDGDFWGGEVTHWMALPNPPAAALGQEPGKGVR